MSAESRLAEDVGERQVTAGLWLVSLQEPWALRVVVLSSWGMEPEPETACFSAPSRDGGNFLPVPASFPLSWPLESPVSALNLPFDLNKMFFLWAPFSFS